MRKRDLKEVKIVGESMPFLRTAWLALNPWNYNKAREKRTRDVFTYFFSFVFLAFVIATLLMLPAIARFTSNQLSHFDTLDISINTSMNSPVSFPISKPFMTIDTQTNTTDIGKGRILVTEENVYTKTLTGKVVSTPTRDYKNLLQNEVLVTVILLLMTPSLLFLFYLIYCIKILLVILLAALVAFIIARLAKFDLFFTEALKVSLLAATPMIIIDLAKMPFALNVYFLQYIVFLIFFVVGIIKIGEFEGTRKKKGYVQL
ncbi:DUF1189 family protein [Candidatus Woesearchaeota archaeon]|nr:DUF1189 family protein [Candidatus Woesearchaeota archaeon]